MEITHKEKKQDAFSLVEVLAAVAIIGVTDEDEVLALLQTRDVTFLGSPYVRPDWNPIESTSAGDYRITWAGRTFLLLKPGTSGTGLKVDFEAGDYN